METTIWGSGSFLKAFPYKALAYSGVCHRRRGNIDAAITKVLGDQNVNRAVTPKEHEDHYHPCVAPASSSEHSTGTVRCLCSKMASPLLKTNAAGSQEQTKRHGDFSHSPRSMKSLKVPPPVSRPPAKNPPLNQPAKWTAKCLRREKITRISASHSLKSTLRVWGFCTGFITTPAPPGTQGCMGTIACWRLVGKKGIITFCRDYIGHPLTTIKRMACVSSLLEIYAGVMMRKSHITDDSAYNRRIHCGSTSPGSMGSYSG